MVTLVVAFNVCLALLCWVVAYQVWQLRHTLAQVTATLIEVERSTYEILHGAPAAILLGQQGTRSLRRQYRLMEGQLQRVKQVLALISLGQSLWRWQGTRAKLRRGRSPVRSSLDAPLQGTPPRRSR